MGKVKKLKDVLAIARTARRAGKKIVATNGCFDMLHIGQVRNLEFAKRQGDILIVGVNSDASVRHNKGLLRPIIPARERAEMLASLESVDYVFIFSDKTTNAWVRKLRPHIHVKAEDAKLHPDFASQKEAIEKSGGVFAFALLTKGRSTTGIIRTILKRYRK